MAFELPILPFIAEDFEPWLSTETFAYHHGKHHAGYVKKLNASIDGTEHAEQDLETIIRETSNNPAIFNNAAQHWNHSFFWECLSAERQELTHGIKSAFRRDFGSSDSFRKEFGEKALKLFGSGWVWLTLDPDEDKLEIGQCGNAATPLTTDQVPLLTLDVWEHAYYIDHRNDRETYIEGFWDHVNWEAVEKRMP
jgi:Fe-Mn family superoxide dismutase